MSENTRQGGKSTTTGAGTPGQQPDEGMGTTTIAEVVVSKIAGLAAREVAGVHALGGGAARALGALRERIPGAATNYSQGISVEVGQTQAAIDVEIVADYGVAIADVADAVRSNIAASIQRMTGLTVIEVNITVSDIWLPEDDSSDDTASPSDEGSRVR